MINITFRPKRVHDDSLLRLTRLEAYHYLNRLKKERKETGETLEQAFNRTDGPRNYGTLKILKDVAKRADKNGW